jgi:hypothetical protein
MSFLDDIVDVGSNLWGQFTGSGVAGSVAKATALGFLLKEVTNSVNKDNTKAQTTTTTAVDPGVRLQVDPDPTHAIPVVYGEAYLGGIVTDARLTNSNQTMWYCITLCEKTGTKISDSADSVITFKEIYWNDQKIVFQSDGITAASTVDNDGTVNTDINDLVKIYCYNNGSTSPVVPTGYTNGSLLAAYGVWATGSEWTSSYTMNNLVFALVCVTYNKDKSVTGLPNMKFKLKNSMTQPGDCLYDYVTNTRYGAGIDSAEINI